MSIFKKLSIAALLSASAISSQAMADTCPKNHPENPNSTFLYVTITREDLGSKALCAYTQGQQGHLLILPGPYTVDNRHGLWKPYMYGLGCDDSRELCAFLPK